MSDQRKPKYVILLRKKGKKSSNKIELFPAHLWGNYPKRFRIRVNGKWHPKGRFVFYTKTQTKELMFRQISA